MCSRYPWFVVCGLTSGGAVVSVHAERKCCHSFKAHRTILLCYPRSKLLILVDDTHSNEFCLLKTSRTNRSNERAPLLSAAPHPLSLLLPFL